jgi:ligand-binding SRPBCC domain-containing protein
MVGGQGHRLVLWRLGVHVIGRSQVVQAPVEQTYAFFSSPRNLRAITPHWLGFQVDQFSLDVIVAGCEIDYTIHWLGLPVRWRTRLLDCEPNVRFTDTQVRGPYKRWWHEHRFQPVGDATRMTDRIEYEMPFNFIGADRPCSCRETAAAQHHGPPRASNRTALPVTRVAIRRSA